MSAHASNRTRLDQLLVSRGFSESRTKAQALILAGQVLVEEQRVDKPGTMVRADAKLRVKQSDPYVSRGGAKLAGALSTLGLDPTAAVCVDVGASTGGFTDCLLQRGARRVYAVDVGQGLLASRLQQDPRVVVMDRTNARHLERHSFPEPIDWVVVDASFIGMAQLADALARILAPGGMLLAMIKPQFEVGKEQARKHRGVIKDPLLRERAIESATATIRAAGFDVRGGCDSQVSGPKGNLEHFVVALRAG